MKILILSTKMPWPPRDGGSIATLNLAEGMARMGHDVTLLTMNTSKHYIPAASIPAEVQSKLNLRSVDVDTRIRPSGLILNLLFSRYPYNAARFRSKDFRDHLRMCLQSSQYDVIQLEGPYLYPYLEEIVASPAKISLRAHNVEHRLWQSAGQSGRNPFIRLYYRILRHRIQRLEKNLLKKVDMLVPISAGDASIFRLMNPALPQLVIGGGLNLERYPETPHAERTTMCYIGALDWKPNQEGLDWFFREAWPLIRKEWPGQQLHLAGRNPSYYLHKRMLPDGVTLHGEVDDAIAFLRKHSVMIVPLLTGSGIRIKILEALALGRIVITTTMGVAGLEVEDGKHLFIADQAADFFKAIRRLRNDPAMAGKMGGSGRQFVREKFDNLVLSRNLSRFYQAQLK